MNLQDFLELKKTLSGTQGFRPNSSMMSEEDRVDSHPFSMGFAEAKVLETKPVDVSGISYPDFSRVYFLDGVQRTVFLGEVFGKPLFLHSSGVAVLSRYGKDLKPFGEPRSSTCLIAGAGIDIDSKIHVEFVEADPVFGMESFMQRSSLIRKRLEQDVFKKAVKLVGKNEMLIYDGPLFYTESLESSNVIGIIKRHSVMYLKDPKMVYSLGIGQRSPAFVIQRGTEGAIIRVVSFYLRLFARRNPYYGVVRVEMPYSMLDSIDKIASFVFSERFPVNLAVFQADKKLYPISVCEKYLSSKLPSVDLLSAFLSDAV